MTFFPLPSKKIGEGAPSPIFSESRATQFPCLFAYFSPQVRELSDFAVLSSSNNQLQSCFFLETVQWCTFVSPPSRGKSRKVQTHLFSWQHVVILPRRRTAAVLSLCTVYPCYPGPEVRSRNT